MLQITIPEAELFDESTGKRIRSKTTTLQLEHSLVSVSKWESKWKKPYLNNTEITPEMSIDYVRCMTLTQCVDPQVYQFLTQKNLDDIRAYIDDPMTATTLSKSNRPGRSQVITAEIIYYWMVTLGIPWDPCQKWHLNRLMTLIRVCDEKNAPKKKMSRRDTLARQHSINQARRARYHTNG